MPCATHDENVDPNLNTMHFYAAFALPSFLLYRSQFWRARCGGLFSQCPALLQRGIRCYRPSLGHPPGWVFGAAWTTVMIGFSWFMGSLWNADQSASFRQRTMGLFAVSWACNVGWNPLFFYAQAIEWALVVITALLRGSFCAHGSQFQCIISECGQVGHFALSPLAHHCHFTQRVSGLCSLSPSWRDGSSSTSWHGLRSLSQLHTVDECRNPLAMKTIPVIPHAEMGTPLHTSSFVRLGPIPLAVSIAWGSMVSCVAPTMSVGVAISLNRSVMSQSIRRPPTLNSLGPLHQIVEGIIQTGE